MSWRVRRAMPAAMLGPFKEARLSSEYQVGGCLGLQRYPGVDSAPRHGNALLGYAVQKADTKSGVRPSWGGGREEQHILEWDSGSSTQ